MHPKGRVLVVAGSDSGGGAGIQADIKTITVLGGYAMTAITALTAQNTLGVHGIYPIPADFVARQMRVTLDDIGADVMKIGMLGDRKIIEAVADVLEEYPSIPLVLDPVMVAKGGAPLLNQDAVAILQKRLVSRSLLVTPNLPEMEALGGDPLVLLRNGAQAVLVKAGHGHEATIDNILYTPQETYHFQTPRIQTRHTHGTGCTLASAIATGLAQGLSLVQATDQGVRYVAYAISYAPGYGKGHGALGHIPWSEQSSC
jgi:hydroxymethylpyrimidine/phosphomethylpyrimidine kinase